MCRPIHATECEYRNNIRTISDTGAGIILTCAANQIARSVARVSGLAAVFETRLAANAHTFRSAGPAFSRVAHLGGQNQRAVDEVLLRVSVRVQVNWNKTIRIQRRTGSKRPRRQYVGIKGPFNNTDNTDQCDFFLSNGWYCSFRSRLTLQRSKHRYDFQTLWRKVFIFITLKNIKCSVLQRIIIQIL